MGYDRRVPAGRQGPETAYVHGFGELLDCASSMALTLGVPMDGVLTVPPPTVLVPPYSI
jgi:hypothetical protein